MLLSFPVEFSCASCCIQVHMLPLHGYFPSAYFLFTEELGALRMEYLPPGYQANLIQGQG